jgi:hypothetical protein
MRKPLGGIQIERDLVHKMQLMVMPSNVVVCWRDLLKRVAMRSASECLRVLAWSRAT